MKEWNSEILAYSLAGHDKGSLFVVLAEEGAYVWLADGKTRLLEKPKKKKRKHVQVIKNLPEDILNQMKSFSMDAHVRRILKTYRDTQNKIQ